MSVVVRMEMPKGCRDCPCVNGEYGYCQADENERQIEGPNEMPSWCPIVCQLPEGHGRLVDADELKATHMFYHEVDNVSYAEERDIDDCPTIVPAEAERSESCETLANLLDQIDRANEFMKEKGLIK